MGIKQDDFDYRVENANRHSERNAFCDSECNKSRRQTPKESVANGLQYKPYPYHTNRIGFTPCLIQRPTQLLPFCVQDGGGQTASKERRLLPTLCEGLPTSSLP